MGPRSRILVHSLNAQATFDAVISNPPFGIKLSSDTVATLDSSFDMKASSSSEAFFLERWFQL